MSFYAIDLTLSELLKRKAGSTFTSGPTPANGDGSRVSVSELQTPDPDALHDGISPSIRSPLAAGAGLEGGDDSESDDDGGGSPAASNHEDAMSVDSDADARSDVSVETPPKPPESE